MINPENFLLSEVKSALPNSVRISGEYQRTSILPLVTLEVKNNTVSTKYIDSSGIENVVEIMVEINAYSNKIDGKKEECKELIECTDDAMKKWHLVRTFCQPTPNLEDSTIFRITARYKGKIDKNKTFYGR
jgi:hypothetical protein